MTLRHTINRLCEFRVVTHKNISSIKSHKLRNLFFFLYLSRIPRYCSSSSLHSLLLLRHILLLLWFLFWVAVLQRMNEKKKYTFSSLCHHSRAGFCTPFLSLSLFILNEHFEVQILRCEQQNVFMDDLKWGNWFGFRCDSIQCKRGMWARTTLCARGKNDDWLILEVIFRV